MSSLNVYIKGEVFQIFKYCSIFSYGFDLLRMFQIFLQTRFIDFSIPAVAEIFEYSLRNNEENALG